MVLVTVVLFQVKMSAVKKAYKATMCSSALEEEGSF